MVVHNAMKVFEFGTAINVDEWVYLIIPLHMFSSLLHTIINIHIKGCFCLIIGETLKTLIQSILVISTSIISNNRLSRRENLLLV